MWVNILEFYLWRGLRLSRGTLEPLNLRALRLFEVELWLRVGVKVIHLVVHSEDDVLTVLRPARMVLRW